MVENWVSWAQKTADSHTLCLCYNPPFLATPTLTLVLVIHIIEFKASHTVYLTLFIFRSDILILTHILLQSFPGLTLWGDY